ncbi:MAG TPA: FKBP-type peptidyl-prolyl cis-trans isomerase [Lacunisphaera sp.]|nr:FKBP-type peptidyl-prolyl cis-trans isomerase [Lacunisphaera sp.]HQY06033.1 FKBP-type peptidyl-prolyl cis-trans isomerase [Lacunisphaera sp.]
MNAPAYRRLAFLMLALLGLAPLHAQREKLPMEDLEIVEQKWPDAKRTYTGLRYLILKPGDAASATPQKGNEVSVLYKGMLLDGTVFDQSPDANSPLKMRLGRGGLIEGWEEALQKMHKGEKWLLIVPPEMAYGARGRPPSIKRNATLVFEMELVDFAK